MAGGLIVGTLVLAAAAQPPADGMPEARRAALARYGAGVWQARRDRLLTAGKSFEAAAKLDPTSAATARELIPVYLDTGRPDAAVRAARTVLAADPRDIDAAHTLARLLFEAGDAAGAVAVLKPVVDDAKLVERPDKALAVWRDFARLLADTGDTPGAVAAHRKVLALLADRRAAVLATRLYTPKEVDAEAADTHERIGTLFAAAKDFDAAAESYRKAAASYADATRAGDPAGAARLQWNLATLHAAKGDGNTAVAYAERYLASVFALKLKPRGAEAYELLAANLRAAGRGGEAAGKLKEYARRDADNPAIKAVLAAELARDPATRPRADALFGELERATADPAAVRLAVRSHVETGRPGRVLDDLDAAYRALDPKAAPTVAARDLAAARAKAVADVLRADRAWAGAVLGQGGADLAAGVKREHATWHVVGLLAARVRNVEVAAAVFRRAVERREKGTEAEAYSQLIALHWRARKPAEVAAVCREGLRAGEFTSEAFLNANLAEALAALGDADGAVAAADKAVAGGVAVDRLSHRLGKVRVLELLGRWDDAVTLARTLGDEFTAPGERERVRHALAGALWGAKKADEAEAELRALLADDPDDAGAANDLGYHLADLGRDLPEAERLVRHVLELDGRARHRSGDPDPANAAYLDSLGWVLFRRGDLPAARDTLLKAAALPDGASDPTVWDHLGDVQFRLGDKGKAKAAWQTAAGLYATDRRGQRDGRPDEVKKKLARVP